MSDWDLCLVHILVAMPPTGVVEAWFHDSKSIEFLCASLPFSECVMP